MISRTGAVLKAGLAKHTTFVCRVEGVNPKESDEYE